MARADAHLAVLGSLPLAYRVVSLTRRVLPDGVAAALTRSPLAGLLRPAFEPASPVPVWVEVSGGPVAGARLLVDLRCEKYYWLGTHERALLRLLEREISGGMTIWDVGAHIGYLSLALSRFAGAAGRVYAFEPLPENLRRLRANVAANKARNVQVQGLAMSDRRGVVRIARSNSTLMASMVGRSEVAGEILAPADTVDHLVQRGLQPPDVLKIDVEGAEALVVRGARETIGAQGPLLAIEIHSVEAGRDVVAALPLPYRFYSVRRRRVGLPVEPGHYVARPELRGGMA
jgi:FkbM family methyltransferase